MPEEDRQRLHAQVSQARLSKHGGVGIPITQFPENAQEALKNFDSNNDGKVLTLELAEAASAFKREKSRRKQATWAAGVLVASFLLLCASNVATSVIAAVAVKDLYVKEEPVDEWGETSSSGPVLESGDGKPVATANLEVVYDLVDMPQYGPSFGRATRTARSFHGGWRN